MISSLKDIQSYSTNIGTPLFLCIGLVGNVLAITTLLRMRQANGVHFLIALSASDLGVMVGWGILWMQRLFQPVLMDYYDWVCKCLYFEFYLSIHFSVSILVAMTTERFIVVWFPIKAKIICKKKHCLIAIGVVFFLILSINLHNLFTRQVLHDVNGTSTFCLASKVATTDMPYGNFHVYVWPWIDAAVYSFIPVISLFILNSLIIFKVKRSAKMAGKASSSENRSTSEAITRTLLIVSFAFLVLTLPIGTVLIIEKNWSFQDDPYQHAIWRVLRNGAGLMELINHSINFFLYCLGGRQFRQAALTSICGCCRRSGSPSPPRSQQTAVSSISSIVQAVSTDHT